MSDPTKKAYLEDLVAFSKKVTNTGNRMCKGLGSFLETAFFLAQVSSLIEGLARDEVGCCPVMEGFECTAREF